MIVLKKNYSGLSYIASNSKLNYDPPLVNLAGEYSSYAPPGELSNLVVEALNQNQKSNIDLDGYFPFREVISKLYNNTYSYYYNPDTEITICSGAEQAFATAISAFVKEGDEVIVFEPSYCTYIPAIEANGGRPVYVQLKQPDFHIDWDEVQKVITVNTKLIILNSPNHITGSLLSSSDLDRLTKIINGTKILILSDEIYESIIFEGYEHQSIARFPKLAERAILISGTSKMLNTENWQLGYCLAPAKLSSDFRKMNHFQQFSVNLPFQIAIANFLAGYEKIPSLGDYFEKKRNLLLQNLEKSKLTFVPSKGAYFQLFNYNEVSDLKDIDFCKQLLEMHNLNTTPTTIFYHDIHDSHYFRVNFARPDIDLKYANEILSKLT